MVKKSKNLYSPREFKDFTTGAQPQPKPPQLSSLRLRSPRAEEEETHAKGIVRNSPRDLERSPRVTNPSPKQQQQQKVEKKKKSNFLRWFVVMLVLAGAAFGVLVSQNIISLGNQKNSANSQMKWNEAVPFLSEQNFTFLVQGHAQFSSEEFLNLTFSRIAQNSSVIKSVKFEFAEQFNRTDGNFTFVTLWFYALYENSNNFRNNITAVLSTGYLAEYQVIGFGEGLQIPRSFCAGNQFGPSCTACTTCQGTLACDSGTMGTGKCICPNVFITDRPLFNLTGNAMPQRCLAMSADKISVGALSVDKSERTFRNLIVKNIGNTSETISGAFVQAGEAFSELVGSYFSIQPTIVWPIILAPGKILNISILFEPKEVGNFSGNVLIFVDNDSLDWSDDATVAIPLSFDGTIDGQYPVNGRIQRLVSLYRINCGSTAKATWEGTTYDEDNWFTTGSTSVTETTVAASKFNPVFRTYRRITSPAPAHYVFPIKYPGKVKLTLRFAEVQLTAANTRRFHVLVNNRTITNSTGLDIFALVGSSRLYNLTYEFAENASLSQISITFMNIVGNAIINSIEIEQNLNLTATSFLRGVSGADINYAEALHKSYLFFHGMYSGNYTKRRMNWRNNSCFLCKGPEGQDLSGGYYEAGGNYLKMSFPMAWTMTMVGMGILEHKQGHIKSQQLDIAMETVKWGYDYLMKCKLDDNRVVLTIGQAFTDDFLYHGPPELYQNYVSNRPIWLIRKDKPFRSSETLGEIAAALAVGSIIFKSVDPEYSKKLITESKEFFRLGSMFPGSYMEGSGKSAGFTEMAQLYPSTGYLDELAWGAAWIYRATGEFLYLQQARSYYMQNQQNLAHGCGFAFSWDEKGPALHVLLSYIDQEESMRQYYDARAKEYFNTYLPGQYRTIPHTPKGLAYVRDWGSTRYAANTAYIAIVYSKYLKLRDSGTAKLRQDLYVYGQYQLDYILGKFGRSMMAGMGVINPQFLLHKSSYNSILYFPRRNMSLTDASNEFFANTFPQVHIPYGAIIGGPIKVSGKPSDILTDQRNQYFFTEPGLDFNGAASAAIAALAEDNEVMPISDADLDLGWNFIPPR